ncbi:hypothetical protein GCM10007269_28660 [Microbacterium murale]|uniref:Secreted protein n=1 Tax=Microbacterium murale TaxID=1081040 RepID=A0ABQ1RYW4_9MICO|nr:hypothetical protein GCM10007269_28660 [Microbacterium murale]
MIAVTSMAAVTAGVHMPGVLRMFVVAGPVYRGLVPVVRRRRGVVRMMLMLRGVAGAGFVRCVAVVIVMRGGVFNVIVVRVAHGPILLGNGETV